MSNIFLTGATGFLASHLLRILLTKENQIYALIRAKDDRTAIKRKTTLINRIFPKPIHRNVDSRIHVVRGDISKKNLGLDKKTLIKLRNTIDTIYHFAAISEFGYSLNAIRNVNVSGTENLLKMALDWQKRGSLENVNHISTVYIAGDFTGIFYEKDTDVSQNFNNTYEKSKFEAELVVSKYRKRDLHIDIYRPSIIINTSPSTRNITPVPQQFLILGILEIFEQIPADEDTELNMLPVDTASKAIYLISTAKNRSLNQNYHIVNPKTIKLGTILNIASDFFNFKKPKCIPAARFHMDGLSLVQQKIIKPFMPYLNQRLSFDMGNSASILKRYNFEVPSIRKKGLIKILKYYKSSLH